MKNLKLLNKKYLSFIIFSLFFCLNAQSEEPVNIWNIEEKKNIGESPVINGDGIYSRDFTYIDNVIQANLLSLVTTNDKAINTVYNVAYGNRNTLNDLMRYLKEYLSEFDTKISNIKVIYGPNRAGDIPHSHASVDKAKELLNYNPQFTLQEGLKEAVKWYWKNL